MSIGKFGNFEILHELKSGGMGAVLIARRRGPGQFEQLAAVKTIRPEYAATPAIQAMFLDEARILARLTHPGVASVYDFGEDGGTLYMAMEFVAGIPFREFGDMRPPPIIAARAVAEACRGLHAAHEVRDLHGNVLGLVHRDISPDNLMLGYDGHVKVIDFGIALVKNRQAPVTEFGMVKGKPPYMSPEQVRNDPMDRRSDVFSLGVVLWELLTHQLLFDGDSLYAIALAVAGKDIPPPSQRIGGGLPLGLDAVVMNALDRNPETRTPTAAAFAEQLEQVITASGEESLELWAERELASRRDAHRGWVSGIVSGAQGLPKAVGRPSSLVTQLAASPDAPPVASPPLALAVTPVDPLNPHADAKPLTTFVPPAPDDDPLLPVAPQRRLMPLLLVALALAVAAVAVLVVLRLTGPQAPADALQLAHSFDAAGPDARAVILTSLDAPEPPPVDAAVPDAASDAGTHTLVHDAAVRPPPRRLDAAIEASAKPDAAVEPTGTATLRLLPAEPSSYLNVIIDGAPAGTAPAQGVAVHAGKHTIQFFDPKDNHLVDTQVVVVADGQFVTVKAHE